MKFVDINGVMQRARRGVSGSDNVQDAQVKDPTKLGEILRGIMRRVSAVEATIQQEPIAFEVDVGSGGALTTLAHNFGQNVTYEVVHWIPTAVTTTTQVDKPNSLMVRSQTIGTWTNDLVSRTIGGRFRLKNHRSILGVRFGWNHNNKVMKCRVWRDDTSALLATKNITTGNIGFYECFFDYPVTTDLTGTNITVAVYNTTDSNRTYNSDTTWLALQPYELNGDLRVIDQGRFFAGDGLPNSSTAGGTFMVEPILGDVVTSYGSPCLSVDGSTDLNNLVLASHSPGRAVILVTPVQNGALV